MVINKQLAFSVGLSLFFLLFLLLGNSFLLYYLVFAGLIAIFFLRKNLDWSRVNQLRVFFWIWLAFLVTLFVGAFWSKSIPLSIESGLFHAFSFTFFWFIFLLKKNTLNTKELLIHLLLVTGVLSLLSIIFYIMPSWSVFLPGMNVLYPTYGHSHLAAVYLLVLPTAWMVSSSGEGLKKKNIFYYFIKTLPLVFTGLLLLTLGRVALMVGLVETVLFNFFTHKSKKTIFLKLAVFLLTVAIVLSGFLSFSNESGFKVHCPFEQYAEKICKQFSTEARPKYWNQALLALSDNPVFGYGPGTFSLISKKYRESPDYSSAHAHNDWLEITAESGLVAGVFFVALMMGMYLSVIRYFLRYQQKENQTALALWLGLTGIYINTLFDFDWQFFGIYLMTLFFLALLFRGQGKNKLTYGKKNLIIKFGYTLTYLFALAVTVLYILTDILIVSGKTKAAFSLFPYLLPHMKIYATSPQLDKADLGKLLQIYENHTEIYSTVLSNQNFSLSHQEKAAHYQKVVESDAWRRLDLNLPIYLITSGQWQEALDETQKTLDFILYAEKIRGYEVDHTWKQLLAKQALLIANYYYQQERYAEASETILVAYNLDKSSFSSVSEEFTTQELSLSQVKQLLSSLETILPEHFGNKSEVYADYYIRLFLEENNDFKLEKTIKKISVLDIYALPRLWKLASERAVVELQAKPELEKEILENWYKLWLTLREYDDTIGYNEQYSLARSLFDYSYRVSQEHHLIWKQKALEVDPWVESR